MFKLQVVIEFRFFIGRKSAGLLLLDQRSGSFIGLLRKAKGGHRARARSGGDEINDLFVAFHGGKIVPPHSETSEKTAKGRMLIEMDPRVASIYFPATGFFRGVVRRDAAGPSTALPALLSPARRQDRSRTRPANHWLAPDQRASVALSRFSCPRMARHKCVAGCAHLGPDKCARVRRNIAASPVRAFRPSK